MLDRKEQIQPGIKDPVRGSESFDVFDAVGSRIQAIRQRMTGGAAAGLLLTMGLLNGCTLDTKGQGVDNLHNDAGLQDVNPDNQIWPETGGNDGAETGGSSGVGGAGGEDAGDAGGSAGTGGVAGAGGEDAGDAGGSAGTGGVGGAGGQDAGDAGVDAPETSVCGPTEKTIKYSDEMNCYKVLYVRGGNIFQSNSSHDDHVCQSKPYSSSDVLSNDIAMVWVGELGGADGSTDFSRLKFDTCNVNPVYVDGTCLSDCSSVPNWQELATMFNNSGAFITLAPKQTSPWVYNVDQSCACKVYKIHT